jgi:hypothetical protein
LEDPFWGHCGFGEEDPVEFSVRPKDKSVLLLYGGHMAKYVDEGYVSF